MNRTAIRSVSFLAGLWVLVATLALPASAQRQGAIQKASAREVEVTVDDAWPPVGPGLAYPLRIKIANSGPERGLRARFHGSSARPDLVTRTLEVGRGETQRFTLLVPDVSQHWSAELEIEVDGERVEDLVFGIRNFHNLPDFAIADRGRIRGTGILVVDDEASAVIMSGMRTTSLLLASVVFLEPERLSEKWQAYDGLARIAVRGDLWSRIAPDRRAAIETAVRAGGSLVYYAYETRVEGEDLIPSGEIGLGHVERLEIDATSELWADDRAIATRPDHRLTSSSFRIPGVGEIPLTALKIFLTFFVVLVGPVNFFVVGYLWKRRSLLLVTTPGLSLAGSALLFLVSFLAEGLGVRSRTVSWSALDSEKGLAVVRAESLLYAGIAPGDGLVFDPSTSVLSLPRSEVEDRLGGAGTAGGFDPYSGPYSGRRRSYSTRRAPRSSSRPYEVDWSADQAIEAGGLPSRELTWLATGQVVSTRAKVVLERTPDGGRVLVNGLATTIRVGWMQIKAGEILEVEDVEPGAKAEFGADRTIPSASGVPAWLVNTALAKPGDYVLITQTNPWLDLGLSESESEGDLHIVTGRFE